MKNKVTIVLLLVILASIAVLFYQNNLLQNFEQNLRGEILSEWEYRIKMQDSIRNTVESKRKNQEFVMEMNYQDELEEMLNSKVAGVEGEISAFKSKLESLLNSRLTKYEAQTLSFNQQSEARLKKFQEYMGRQEERWKELESSLDQRFRTIENNLEKYMAQAKSLKQEIQKLHKKQAELEKRISAHAAEKALRVETGTDDPGDATQKPAK